MNTNFYLKIIYFRKLKIILDNMKKISILTAVIACFLMFNNSVFAQTKVKLAHINSADLMQVMPGRDTAQKVIENYSASLEEE